MCTVRQLTFVQNLRLERKLRIYERKGKTSKAQKIKERIASLTGKPLDASSSEPSSLTSSRTVSPDTSLDDGSIGFELQGTTHSPRYDFTLV